MTADFKQGVNLVGSVLASGQLATTTATTIYTVPASSATKVAAATLCNTSGSTVTVSVAVVPNGGSVDGTHRVIDSYPLAAHDTILLTEIIGSFLDAGALISVTAGTANVVDYFLSGVVSS